MKLIKSDLNRNTKGENDLVDITGEVRRLVRESKVRDGFALIFVIGSTASIITMEYEPGLIKDIKELFERLAPYDENYAHNQTWGDDNGHSHLRASIFGQSFSAPIENGELIIGTWQQIVLAEFDHRPRQRRVVVQIYGE